MVTFNLRCVLFSVGFTKSAKKQFDSLERSLKESYLRFFAGLAHDPFIGKLYGVTYHAHIKYKWVAVWNVDKDIARVTITYVGSREDAPYGR
jgi:mRNA-degrading endonuclease RelE of RelBE toxin-antitoxin system